MDTFYEMLVYFVVIKARTAFAIQTFSKVLGKLNRKKDKATQIDGSKSERIMLTFACHSLTIS